MPNVYVDAVSGVALYLKLAVNGEVTASPWSTGLVSGTYDSDLERWSFTVTAGATYFAFQQVGVSPASSDDHVGTFSNIEENPSDIPPPVSPSMCTVRFIVVNGAGAAIEKAVVIAELAQDEIHTLDTALVARSVTSGVTNQNGICDLSLVRRASFTRGGTYRVHVETPDGSTVVSRRVTVPNLATAFAEDLLDA